LSFSWPTYNGLPIPFVSQINLSEVTPYDMQHLLPSEGMLFFFFDIDAFFETWPRQQNLWCVLYDSSVPPILRQVTIPETIAMRNKYRPTAVTYSTEITLPDYSRYDATSIHKLGLSSPLTREEEQAYYEVQSQLAGTAGITYHLPLHRLLGYPDDIQEDMHRDLAGDLSAWQLLFQMDSDSVPNTEWGDTGRIYYWIREQDLAKRDFSKVELILQST